MRSYGTPEAQPVARTSHCFLKPLLTLRVQRVANSKESAERRELPSREYRQDQWGEIFLRLVVMGKTGSLQFSRETSCSFGVGPADE